MEARFGSIAGHLSPFGEMKRAAEKAHEFACQCDALGNTSRCRGFER